MILAHIQIGNPLPYLVYLSHNDDRSIGRRVLNGLRFKHDLRLQLKARVSGSSIFIQQVLFQVLHSIKTWILLNKDLDPLEIADENHWLLRYCLSIRRKFSDALLRQKLRLIDLRSYEWSHHPMISQISHKYNWIYWNGIEIYQPGKSKSWLYLIWKMAPILLENMTGWCLEDVWVCKRVSSCCVGFSRGFVEISCQSKL